MIVKSRFYRFFNNILVELVYRLSTNLVHKKVGGETFRRRISLKRGGVAQSLLADQKSEYLFVFGLNLIKIRAIIVKFLQISEI